MNTKEAILSLDFFESLDEESIDILASFASLERYSSEYILYYEQTKIDALQFLISGLVKAFKIDKYGNEIFLFTCPKGRMLSEITSFAESELASYSNMITQEETLLLNINYHKFKKQFLDQGLLYDKFANEIIRQTKQMQDVINKGFIYDSTTKVAMMLENDLDAFNRLKRYDVSLMLHIQPATLSRVLNRLRRDGIIDIEKGEVEIKDRDKLLDIYKGLL